MVLPRDSKHPYLGLVPTPDLSERVVQLFVPQRFFSDSVTLSQGMTLSAVLTALEPTETTDAIEKGYQDYTLTQPVLDDTSSGDGVLSFYFAKPKASSSLLDLTPFKEETEWMKLDWPAVLLSLYGVFGKVVKESYNNSVGGFDVTAHSYDPTIFRELYEDRIAFIPRQQIFTEVVIRYYTSNLPFTDVILETPVTNIVQYSYKGMQQSLDCIHDDVFIPELFKGGKRIENFGTKNAQERPYEQGQFYPATLPMTTWQNHLFDAKYSSERGSYSLVTYEALAPALPDPILL